MGKSVKPLTLPCEEGPLNAYTKINKVFLMEHIVNTIDYAINKNIPTIDVFNIDESDYVIQLDNNSFKDNLDYIYDYYIQNELYEYCGKVYSVKEKLKKTQLSS